jgi:hypothetical protein
MYINGKLAKTGKKPAVHDPRTLKLAHYLDHAALSPPPTEVSYITKLASAETFPMYLNDQLGDCVAAAAGHMIQQWNFYAGHPAWPTEAEILKTYEDVGGYVPGNPSTDNGMDMLSYLKYWRKTGVGDHKIAAFVAINWNDSRELQTALALFESVYLGVGLPISAQGQTSWTVPNGGIYSPAGAEGGWGGHCIPIFASSPITKTVVTWGGSLKMSDNFLLDYGDEAYVVLSADMLNGAGVSPGGFNLSQLKTDLAAITT